MKITYHQNPLWTTVELDDHEKKELWYKIKIAEMEDLAFGAYFHLNEGDKHYDPKEARKELDPEYWCTDEKSKLDERVDTLHAAYLNELMTSHGGDCTCFACSCMKCQSESIVGIDTI